MKNVLALSILFIAVITGCSGDSEPPVTESTPVVTPPAPTTPALDSALLDSIAMAQADSAVAAAVSGAPTTPPSTRSGGTPAGGTGPTIWDGVYTYAQANRGKQVAEDMCWQCHTEEVFGRPGLLAQYGNNLGGIFHHVSENMPFDNPGSLSYEEYASVIAYMLSLTNAPGGDRELPATAAGLEAIRVTPRP